MKNKFANNLLAFGALAVISIGVGLAINKSQGDARRAAVLAEQKYELQRAEAVEAARLANPNAEQKAFCKKHNVLIENCVKVYELVQSGQPVVGINSVEQPRETFGEFLDRGAQRKNDLAWCRQNPGDWSCREGQYKGQY